MHRKQKGLTRYTNPSEASTMFFILSFGVVGVVKSTFSNVKEQYKINKNKQSTQG